MFFAEWFEYLPSFWEWFPTAAFIFLLIFPFALFGWLLKKRRKEQTGYGDNNPYCGPPI